MMWPSSGLIQRGREVWSGFRCSQEKSWSMNIWETRLPSFALLASTSFRVNALKLIVAPGETSDASGRVCSWSELYEPFFERLIGFEGPANPVTIGNENRV